MKKTKLFAMMACMTMLAAACGKDDDSKPSQPEYVSPIKVISTFDDLNSYLGRTDIDNLKYDFNTDNYLLNEKSNGFVAKKNYDTDSTNFSTSYSFEITQGVITSATFSYGSSDLHISDLMRNVVLERLYEEKTFSADNTMVGYNGYVKNGDSDQLPIASREEFIAWFNSDVILEDVKGESTCTYENYETLVSAYLRDCTIGITRK
ncbi:MAG: hypothetical protein ACSW8I_09575 [bacterium]